MDEKKIAYKRVLLKLSGEALSGDAGTGLDFKVMAEVCGVVAQCAKQGVEVGIVVGGGNFWRGVKNGEGRMDRWRADYMGMLATVMNCLALQDVLQQQGVEAKVLTAMEIQHIGEPVSVEKADEYLRSGKVVVFARSSRPTQARCCARRSSARTRYCLPRTWTAFTAPTRRRTPTRFASTLSHMRKCSKSVSRSWTARRRALPWTTASPSRCSPCANRKTSCAPPAARPSARWSIKRKTKK